MAIGAAAAATVSLVEHADDSRTPSVTAWPLGGAVAVVLASIAFAAVALPDDEFPAGMAEHIAPTCGAAIVMNIAVAAIRPAPLAFGIVINVALLLAWLWLFMVFLARGGGIETTRAETASC
jgi:hypothetical protein